MVPRKATIADAACVRGRISGDEDLLVLGRIEGEIDLHGMVEVDVGAVVKARIRADSARVAGVVVGDIAVVDLLYVAATARIVGDLRAARLVVEPGAKVSAGVTVVERVIDGSVRSYERAGADDSMGRPVGQVERRTVRGVVRAPSSRMPTLEPEIEPSDPQGADSSRLWGSPFRAVTPSMGPDSARKRVTVRIKPRRDL